MLCDCCWAGTHTSCIGQKGEGVSDWSSTGFVCAWCATDLRDSAVPSDYVCASLHAQARNAEQGFGPQGEEKTMLRACAEDARVRRSLWMRGGMVAMARHVLSRAGRDEARPSKWTPGTVVLAKVKKENGCASKPRKGVATDDGRGSAEDAEAAAALRKWRTSRDMSQEELGRFISSLGFDSLGTQSSISNFEGRRKAGLQPKMGRVARAFLAKVEQQRAGEDGARGGASPTKRATSGGSDATNADAPPAKAPRGEGQVRVQNVSQADAEEQRSCDQAAESRSQEAQEHVEARAAGQRSAGGNPHGGEAPTKRPPSSDAQGGMPPTKAARGAQHRASRRR